MSEIPQGYDVRDAYIQEFFEEYKGLLEILPLVFQTLAKSRDVRSFNLLLQGIANIAHLAKEHMGRQEEPEN